MSHAAAAARLGRSKTPIVIRCVYTVYTQFHFNHQFRGIWRGRECDAQNAEPLNTRWISSRLPCPTLPSGPEDATVAGLDLQLVPWLAVNA